MLLVLSINAVFPTVKFTVDISAGVTGLWVITLPFLQIKSFKTVTGLSISNVDPSRLMLPNDWGLLQVTELFTTLRGDGYSKSFAFIAAFCPAMVTVSAVDGSKPRVMIAPVCSMKMVPG